MVDRRINFGDPADSGTRWQMEDAANVAGGGNFVLARDLDGGTVLLQYNPTSNAFEFVRAVDMGGEDVTGVGGVVGESGTGVYDDATTTVGDGTTNADHESVSTDTFDTGIDDPDNGDVTSNRSFNTEYQNTTGNLLEVVVQINADDVVPDVSFAKDSMSNLSQTQDMDRFTFRGVAGDGYQIIGTVRGVIPDGHYYSVREGNDNNSSILVWKETEFKR